MSESNTEKIITSDLFGRRNIYTPVDEITPFNVVDEVQSALIYHFMNMMEEERLYWYRRGVQPILQRTKERNSFVLNKPVMNVYEEVVSFKNGFYLPEPAYYTARNNEAQDRVDRLNEYLYRSGKHAADKEAVNWFHTVGKGVIFVNQTDDPERPFEAYGVDPRNAFVVYSMKPGNEPVYGVNFVINGGRVYIDVYTRDVVYKLSGAYDGRLATSEPVRAVTAVAIESTYPQMLDDIPLIEYMYNANCQAAPEPAITLCDEINNLTANRLDAVEQFVQSLLVITNADLPDGEDANSLKAKGILQLYSTGDLKADVEILSEQLDQTQSQVLIDDLYERILTICSMPSTTKGGTSTSDTGQAVLYRDGWQQAAACAVETEHLFRKSNRHFDRIILGILRDKGLLDLSINDFELKVNRTETANMQSKAQAFQTLLAAGLHPELAAAKSGISNDPVSDIKRSEKYLQMIWGDPDKPKQEKRSVDIVEEDNNNGESDAQA